MYKSLNNNSRKDRKIDLIDLFRLILGLLKKYYYLFIICVLLSIFVAYAYIKYTGQNYLVYTSLVVENDQNKGFSNNNNTNIDMIYSDISTLLPGSNNVDNQIYILKSYDNVFKTIKKLNLDVSYFDDSKLLSYQLYKNYPFVVVMDKSKPQLVEANFKVEHVNNKKFRLVVNCKEGQLYNYITDRVTHTIYDLEYEKVHKYGEVISNSYFSFYLKKQVNNLPGKDFSFVLNNPHILTKTLKGNMGVERVVENGGVVRISLKTKSPQQGIDILNKFTEVYLQDNINKKNAVVDKMIEFVEAQFDNVANSLKVSDDRLQVYQSNKNVVDIAAQGQLVIQQVNALENERSQISAKLVYLDNLKNNIIKGDNNSGMVAPTAMGIDDIVLNNLVTRINEISIQRSALVSGLNNPEVNPQVIAMDAQLNELKKSLADNVDNIISQIKIVSKDINVRIAKNRRLLKELPSKQRGLVNIKRNNEINSELYSNLLERKLNYYIMKASNILKKDVVEEARLADYIPLVDKKEFIYLFSLFWGFLIPLCIIILIQMLDNKIKSKYDIEEITNYPLLGTIPQVKREADKDIKNNPFSVFSESYRLIRHRLGTMVNSDKAVKIMVTSTFPQEGKTLTSVNIATTFAMLKKKTILVGCDLRKPDIGNVLKLNEDVGLSSYLLGQSKIKNIVKKTDHEFLDVIVSGTPPQNPYELMGSDFLKNLISELEKKYEYIIFDTPPVGIVADALFLSKFVDLKLLIVRSGKTEKRAFEEILNRLVENNMRDVGIIFNGERYSNGKYYGYKYVSYNN